MYSLMKKYIVFYLKNMGVFRKKGENLLRYQKRKPEPQTKCLIFNASYE